ncbi:alanine racemase [Ectopseudomonas mendocina]|uniref:Alanine racemase n=1 Tax=Ectopseudomonas mendocina TaxID=300 RepID=A0ABZ2RCP3_ECTME
MREDLGRVSPPTVSKPLPAHQHPLIGRLLGEHHRRLNELVQGLGSPLHVVLPQVFDENLARMQRVLDTHHLQSTILFAKKANKADCFARAAAERHSGIDVASSGELSKALSAGVRGDRIGLSGPDKPERLLKEALLHGCLISVDSVNELQRLTLIAANLNQRARTLLRWRPESEAKSRFGHSEEELNQSVLLCLANPSTIELQGFSFHLSGYGLAERATCTSRAIDLCLQARALGLVTCNRVDIGGGLPVQYVSAQHWNRFLQHDHRTHYHANKSFSGFYPYGSEIAGANALEALLQAPTQQGSLAHKLRHNGIHLIIEPGRALLDQAGLTLFNILGSKQRSDYSIITVEGSSLSLSEQWFNSEYLPDPVLLGEPCGSAFNACVGGSTCLDSDMVSWRKVPFSRPVLPGEKLVYINTAGYQMDSNESAFHDAAIPRKVVIELDPHDHSMHWRLDDI